MNKALFLSMLFFCFFIQLNAQKNPSFAWNKPATPPPTYQPSTNLVWEPYIDWGQQIFPSFLLSIATTDPQQFSAGTDYLGDPKSVIGLFIKSPESNTEVTVNIAATRFTSALSETYTLPQAQQQYAIFPKVVWNYDLLRQNRQSLPLNFSYTVSLGGTTLAQKTATATLRGIGDCPLAAIDYQGKQVDLRKMFAAYVNEDHPKINELLGAALQKKTVNSFNGYQGKREEVVAQVFAFWRLFRDKGMKYSDMATSSHEEHHQVISQRVRTFEETINTSQANCIDGTVLFASLMRSIGLHPLIILVPGHAMLGFYLDEKQADILVLETTLIGEPSARNFSSKHEFAPYIQAIGAKSQAQTASTLFLKALDTGYDRFMQAWKKDQKSVLIIDVAQSRSLYKPIGR
jgi:hypothetical protein